MQIRVAKLEPLVAVPKSETRKSSEAPIVVKAVAGANVAALKAVLRIKTVTVIVEAVGQQKYQGPKKYRGLKYLDSP